MIQGYSGTHHAGADATSLSGTHAIVSAGSGTGCAASRDKDLDVALDWKQMHRLPLLIAFCAAILHAETALVLPFFNHSKSANLEWIGESIAESVRDSLASHGILALDRADRLEAYRRLSLRPNAELTHA